MRSVLYIVLLAFITASCSPYAKVLKSKDYEYKLKMADEYFVKKKYKIARQLYEEVFPVYKGNEKFEDIYYKYAYCFYYLKEYNVAENMFKGFLEVFPNSSKAEEVDYMHAYCFYKQSPKVELEQVNTLKAMGMMQTFINTHPGSSKVQEAANIIDECRKKLELKAFNGAQLYFNLGQYKAAAVAFENLLASYPESEKGDEYKLMALKAYFKYAQLSMEEKQMERFEKVVSEYQDFADRYPDSKLLKEAESYSNQSKNYLKEIKK